MSVQGGGEAGVKELVEEIHIGLFVWEIIDEMVDIDGDINTVDTSGRTRKVI